MALVLEIDGTPIDRIASRVTLQELALSYRSAGSLEFSQRAVTPDWGPGQVVTLTDGATLLFTGTIASVDPGQGDLGLFHAYKCLDLRYSANFIPITNPNTGTGLITFNLPSTDDDYLADFAGKSVGEILQYLFDEHGAALLAAGIPAYHSADLTPLTIVPTSPVNLRGRFWSAVEDLVTEWYNQYVPYIEPDGTIRVLDTTAFTPVTLTKDHPDYAIAVQGGGRDTGGNYSRVEIRGAADIDVSYNSLAQVTLGEAFTSGDKTAWKYSDYTSPKNAADTGDITSPTSTTLTVTSSNATRTWATNFWSGATVYAIDPIATGLGFTEQRVVTACTALTAGGSSVLTLDRPLNSSGYTDYSIVGSPTGISTCWRLYNILPNPGWVREHLVKRFTHSFAWTTAGMVQQLMYPVATICNSAGVEVPWEFKILPATGQILFNVPVVKPFATSISSLETGGASTTGIPANIKVALPFSRGVLTAVYPPDDTAGEVHAGTLWTADGIPRTLYREFPQWSWGADQANYELLAEQIHRTVCDTVVAGTVTYFGKYSAALGLGMALNVDQYDGVPTGLEAVNCPVMGVTLEFPPGGPVNYVTRLEFSNARRPYSGDRLYAHPAFGAESVLDNTNTLAGWAWQPSWEDRQTAGGDNRDLTGKSDNRDLAPGSRQQEFTPDDIREAGRDNGAGIHDPASNGGPNPVRTGTDARREKAAIDDANAERADQLRRQDYEPDYQPEQTGPERAAADAAERDAAQRDRVAQADRERQAEARRQRAAIDAANADRMDRQRSKDYDL